MLVGFPSLNTGLQLIAVPSQHFPACLDKKRLEVILTTAGTPRCAPHLIPQPPTAKPGATRKSRSALSVPGDGARSLGPALLCCQLRDLAAAARGAPAARRQTRAERRQRRASPRSHLWHRCHRCVSQFSHPELRAVRPRPRAGFPRGASRCQSAQSPPGSPHSAPRGLRRPGSGTGAAHAPPTRDLTAETAAAETETETTAETAARGHEPAGGAHPPAALSRRRRRSSAHCLGQRRERPPFPRRLTALRRAPRRAAPQGAPHATQ